MKGNRMNMTTSEWNPYNSNPSYFVALRRPPPKSRPSIRVHRLNRRNRRRRLSKEAREKVRVRVLKREMEIKNLKLYMENQSIIKENDKLRKKALLLHQENKALLSQLQKISYPRG